MSVTATVRLNNGLAMPRVGFGSFQIPEGDTARAIDTALDAGYRAIDTAAVYGNESAVGKAVAASGLPRASLFVITKLWNSDHGYHSALDAFDSSLDRLGLAHVDLYLIHWPVPERDRYLETWEALQALASQGRVRAIGVSNFGIAHLRRLIDATGVVPAVNQIELHPWLPQAQVRAFHAEHGIATQAWSPLGQGRGLLSDPRLAAVAASLGKTPAQIVLRWHLELGNLVIPKSASPERIRENIDLFDFELSAADHTLLATLDTGVRLGPDPDTFHHV